MLSSAPREVKTAGRLEWKSCDLFMFTHVPTSLSRRNEHVQTRHDNFLTTSTLIPSLPCLHTLTMAPVHSESSILHQFLLTPAQLPEVISLADFSALFPKPLQTSPQVRTLYRDLQRQRNAVVDEIAADIEAEASRGRLLHRNAVRARLRANAQEDITGDDELQLEHIITKSLSVGSDKYDQHDLVSVIVELGAAVQYLETGLQDLDNEDVLLRHTIQQTIGTLSDLRYGRLANPQLRDQVLEGLSNVHEACRVEMANSTIGRAA